MATEELKVPAEAPSIGKAQEEEQTRAPNAEKSANFISRLGFSYITGLMIKGFRRPLSDLDLWDLDKPDSTTYCLSRFDHYWNIQQAKPKYATI